MHITSDLRWNTHVDKICGKASARLYFLKQLKRAGLATCHLHHFYISAIRPVLEYCSVVWHHSLTREQSEHLEAIQRRAIRIIYGETFNIPYQLALVHANLSSLCERRENLNKSFFSKVLDPDSCLFTLLPPPRDSSITSRLRSAPALPVPRTRTSRYRSFLHHALANYQ